jgi:hypothetical protein
VQESNSDNSLPFQIVTANVSAPKAKVPEQLGLSLPTHDRASWRMLARLRHLGCIELPDYYSQGTACEACAASGPSAVDPISD